MTESCFHILFEIMLRIKKRTEKSLCKPFSIAPVQTNFPSFSNLTHMFGSFTHTQSHPLTPLWRIRPQLSHLMCSADVSLFSEIHSTWISALKGRFSCWICVVHSLTTKRRFLCDGPVLFFRVTLWKPIALIHTRCTEHCQSTFFARDTFQG